MKGDKKVIEYLNAALRSELTAVSQYWLHYRLQEDWGYGRMTGGSSTWRPRAAKKASKRCSTPTS